MGEVRGGRWCLEVLLMLMLMLMVMLMPMALTPSAPAILLPISTAPLPLPPPRAATDPPPLNWQQHVPVMLLPVMQVT